MGPLLQQVNSPADVKKLASAQLKTLADEIRQFILDSVSQTGGHLASNLGVVELTLALHRVFDFERDKLLWDVGHQCYAHKIITGRKDAFERLRQAGGLSGFPNPAESAYDQFTVGHAGTAIATAVGMALGEQLKSHAGLRPDAKSAGRPSDVAGRAPRIVAIVGDASIVNGTSFEALNNLGLVKRQLLIVLNDNNMAIDPTVGAVAKYFAKIRLSHTYEDLRKTTSSILEHMPVIGKSMEEAIERIKKSIRMVLPASQLFESLNVPYFGPVDGHDIGSLTRLFEAVAELNHPAILHVYTQKGKGFRPADARPSKFHSTGPFKINGEAVESPAPDERQSFTSVFGQHLTMLAETDKRIVAITSAMCDGTGLLEFRERFSDRFYDVGIAESAAVDIAAGLSKVGLRPFVCIYSTFLQRGFDQIFQEVTLQNLPVVFCIDRAGFVGADGPTHHGLMDIGYLRMMPNIAVTAPANDVEMRLAIDFALKHDGPVAIRYPKDFVPEKNCVPPECSTPFVLGRSVIIKQTKDADVTIVGFGAVLSEVLKAADVLTANGIAVDVVNARFAAPLDRSLIRPATQGKCIISVEDHASSCGFGSALLEEVAAKGSIGKVRVLGAPRECIAQAGRSGQLAQAGVDAAGIVAAVRQAVACSGTLSDSAVGPATSDTLGRSSGEVVKPAFEIKDTGERGGGSMTQHCSTEPPAADT